MSVQEFGSWHSSDYVADWIGQDVLGEMLELPRRISVALVAQGGVLPATVVDLGAGPGAYLDVLLSAFPRARGTWVDSSEPMQAAARNRLSPHGDRVDYVLGDIEQLDELGLPRADVIVTSRVLHHFSPESLERFYGRAHAALRAGGFFFNLDHFGTAGDWEQRYRAIREQFTGPRKSDVPPHRHDFPFRRIDEHLAWLERAGFDAPDVPWRTFFTALLAARKRT